MKHIFLSSASTLILIMCASAASAAPAQVSGFVGINLGADWTDFDVNSTSSGTDDTVFVFGGDAHINAWLDPGMSVQFDVQTESTTSIETEKSGSSSGNDGRVGGIIGAHVSWRNPSSHLIGVFGGFSGQNNLDYDGTMTNAIIGLEGQVYCDHLTLYGQVGYAPLMSDSEDEEADNLCFLRAVGRYFLNPNDKLQAEVSYGRSDVNEISNLNYDMWNWGLSWQHRLSNSPFSTTIAYQGMWVGTDGYTPERDATENQVTVSLNIHFNSSSLEQTDREGETLDMPNFGRAQAWGWWLGNP